MRSTEPHAEVKEGAYQGCRQPHRGDNYVPITLDLFFENMRRYQSGEALLSAVRPEPGY